MYKVITSLWSTPTTLKKTQSNPSASSVDDDSWVFVSETGMVIPAINNPNSMTNSWIASPPLIKTDDIHQFNPIENLLIEHASMSVYEQITSKRRQRKPINERKLGEDDGDDDDDEERIPTNQHHQDLNHRNLNISPNVSVTTLESSTSSLVAHHRHLLRLHQRRKRSNKAPTSSKLILTTTIDDTNSLIERQRTNLTRSPKTLLQQSSRLNH